jgi:hypothetical protein
MVVVWKNGKRNNIVVSDSGGYKRDVMEMALDPAMGSKKTRK